MSANRFDFSTAWIDRTENLNRKPGWVIMNASGGSYNYLRIEGPGMSFGKEYRSTQEFESCSIFPSERTANQAMRAGKAQQWKCP